LNAKKILPLLLALLIVCLLASLTMLVLQQWKEDIAKGVALKDARCAEQVNSPDVTFKDSLDCLGWQRIRLYQQGPKTTQ